MLGDFLAQNPEKQTKDFAPKIDKTGYFSRLLSLKRNVKVKTKIVNLK
jgi:hypothetical protein